MNLSELQKNILPEDVAMTAVKNEVSYDYVAKILNGARNVKSVKAKSIVKTLKQLAKVNQGTQLQKERIVKSINPVN